MRSLGAVAQLGERLPCTQEVRGSILLGSTIYTMQLTRESRHLGLVRSHIETVLDVGFCRPHGRCLLFTRIWVFNAMC